jgi:NAD(P)H-flavin reductase
MNKECFNKGKKLAVEFISKKYQIPKKKFEIPILLQTKKKVTSYVREEHPKNNYITFVAGEKKWYTYKLKTVGIYADGVNISPTLSYALQLVHEFTHHVQFLQKRKFSEIETTFNEIEFILKKEPKLLLKLKRV